MGWSFESSFILIYRSLLTAHQHIIGYSVPYKLCGMDPVSVSIHLKQKWDPIFKLLIRNNCLKDVLQSKCRLPCETCWWCTLATPLKSCNSCTTAWTAGQKRVLDKVVSTTQITTAVCQWPRWHCQKPSNRRITADRMSTQRHCTARGCHCTYWTGSMQHSWYDHSPGTFFTCWTRQAFRLYQTEPRATDFNTTLEDLS